MARVATGPAPRSVETARPRDRRHGGNRQPLEMLGLLIDAKTPDNQLEVAVLNVSPAGCAFRSPVAFRSGAVYTMRIGTGPLHLTSTIRIISSRDRADGLYEIGAKFV